MSLKSCCGKLGELLRIYLISVFMNLMELLLLPVISPAWKKRVMGLI